MKYRNRFPVERESWLEEFDEADTKVELYVDRLNQALAQNSAELTERETLVLGWRFPKNGASALTLGAVGAAIGLSKERVRQIQDKALSKLPTVLDADPALQCACRKTRTWHGTDQGVGVPGTWRSGWTCRCES